MSQNPKNSYHSLIEEIDSRAMLIAVSKKRSLPEIKALYDLGQRDFGENRVEELAEKSAALVELEDIRWHFIGNLQSKKITKLLSVQNLISIHSVDRIKLIKALADKACLCEIFLQVNISGEVEKSGFKDLGECQAAYELAKSLKLKVKGLMAMAGIRVDDQDQAAKKQFSALRKIRDEIDHNLELSIGMSNDYKIALESDAKYLRIGSLLFS